MEKALQVDNELPAGNTGYFPDLNETEDYIQNSSCRFEIRHAPSGDSYVVSIPHDDVFSKPIAYLGSASATLLDYPLSAIPFVHRSMTAEEPSILGRLFLRIGSRPRRSIGLFNQPFSNILLPENFLSILEEILPQYRTDYPDRPLFIRGLIRKRFAYAFSRLRQLGFVLIPYRRIFIFEERREENYTRHLRRDLSGVRKHRHLFSLPTEPLPPHDYEKMAELYRKLYLEKYTSLNPGYTAAFIRHVHQLGLITLSVCRDERGSLIGFSCFTCDNSWMSSNMVGHDRQKMRRPSIYFSLFAMEMEIAMQRGACLNLGAGAQKTKIARGCRPDIEYLAVRLPPESLLHAVRDLGQALWK